MMEGKLVLFVCVVVVVVVVVVVGEEAIERMSLVLTQISNSDGIV